MERDGASAPIRILGVIAAAMLAIGTFGTLGLALLNTLYERGVVGHRGLDEMESLTYLGVGVVVGTVVGVVVAVWVGMRVWHSQWTLLILLTALACVTAATMAIAFST
ncbi:MAG: hypothetical protein M3P10_12460 [Actinomycetota bacterium]|nr:hypothetical protein [Actinomycetota bacterium]